MSIEAARPEGDEPLRIASLGVGQIGGTLASRFAAAGHEVRVANSRAPSTVKLFAESIGAQARHGAEAVLDADVVVVSVPFNRIAELRSVVSRAPADAVLVDTTNYYPHRDGELGSFGPEDTESEWVANVLGRPVVKAWNSILAGSLQTAARPSGAADRMALPVSGDDPEAVGLVCGLVDVSGFDPVVAGPLAQSWRQQPGAPAYTTDLAATELVEALARAERHTLAERRGEMVRAIRHLRGWGTHAQRLAIARRVFL